MEMTRNLLLAITAAMLSACSNSGASNEGGQDDKPALTISDRTDADQSLAFEWSANGFEQLPAQYVWTGSGQRDDVYQPNLSLSVPETDDTIWSSECAADGKISTTIYFAAPAKMKADRSILWFETDASAQTLHYPVNYISNGQFDGFRLVQAADDPMFADMRAGKWAYVHIGEGADGTKLRISLANAAKGLNAFLPACSKARARADANSSVVVRYSCDDGRSIRATYLGNNSDKPTVRVEIGDAHYILPQVVSGSGARYEGRTGGPDGTSQTWHSKGSMGVFTESDAPGGNGNAERSTTCQAV